MLHVGRVRGEDPRIDGNLFAEDLGLEHQLLVRIGKVGQVVGRLGAVERPDHPEFFGHRKSEQPRATGDRVAAWDMRAAPLAVIAPVVRSEEHTSELQSLMRISYAVFCLKKKKKPVLISIVTTKIINI